MAGFPFHFLGRSTSVSCWERSGRELALCGRDSRTCSQLRSSRQGKGCELCCWTQGHSVNRAAGGPGTLVGLALPDSQKRVLDLHSARKSSNKAPRSMGTTLCQRPRLPFFNFAVNPRGKGPTSLHFLGGTSHSKHVPWAGLGFRVEKEGGPRGSHPPQNLRARLSPPRGPGGPGARRRASIRSSPSQKQDRSLLG